MNNTEVIAQAEKEINNFLNVSGRTIYVINPDGSTFTLEKGCMLLAVDNAHMEEYDGDVMEV